MPLNRTHILPFAWSALSVVVVAALCYPLTPWLGYQSVALILLLVVSILAMRLSLYPVLLAAVLSAAIWDFFFIPPFFTFHVNAPADALLLGMYFIVALLHGVLTARIRRFERLANEEAARSYALRLYDTLFSALAHELRTPIATILGASDHLLASASGAETGTVAQKSLYAEINAAAERLHRLTDSLLHQSRLDSGAIRPKCDWCEPGELVYTVTGRLETELSRHRLEIEVREGLPLVWLDFGLMEQALQNLLLNAVKYAPPGAPIWVKANYAEGVFEIAVEDAGPGFPPEELSRVFEKFKRFSQHKTGGLGLGLSIAKGFVEAHGGNISAQNIPGGGARIALRIPTPFHELNTGEDG